MKNRKIFMTLIFVLLIILVIMQPVSNAESTKILSAQKLREGLGGTTRYAYRLNGKDVWKIYEVPDDFSQAIYCLAAGVGNLWNGQQVTYNSSEVLTAPGETIVSLSEPRTNLFYNSGYQTPDVQSTYNNGSLLWLLDNIYLPKHPNELERQQLRNKLLSEVFKDELESNTIPPFTLEDLSITDDDIEVVQQWAIWQFTTSENYDDLYTSNILPAMHLATGTSDNDLSQYDSLDTEEGYARQEESSKLFNYLVTNARNNSNYGVERNRANNIQFVKTSGRVTITNNVAGPFKLSATYQDNLYDLSLTLRDQNDRQITNYTLKDADGNVLLMNKDILGKTFYVHLSNNGVTKVTLDVSAKYYTSLCTKWTASDIEGQKQQPVVIVEKQPHVITTKAQTVEEESQIDLVLRKSITSIDGVERTNRLPVVDSTALMNQTDTTAKYSHIKTPVAVDTNSLVEYTLTIYNEGNKDGYAKQIIDYLPEGLDFIELVNANGKYEATLSKNGRRLTITNIGEKVIPAYTGQGTPSNDTITIKCRVTAERTEQEKTLTNIAEITQYADNTGIILADRDSTSANFPQSIIDNPESYIGKGTSIDGEYTLGQEDDDDFEKLLLPPIDVQIENFDLSLKKFITAVNDTLISTRVPVVDTTPLANKTTTDAIYTHTKEPVLVNTGDLVTYTIRVYNEGEIDGYAQLIVDNIPKGLEFDLNNDINLTYGWSYYSEEDITKVKTDYLSKEKGIALERDNIIPAFNGNTLSFKDIKIVFRVTETDHSQIITNTAEIYRDSDQEGNEVNDIDSTPGNNILTEDDIDQEHLRLTFFDLALRKFITKVEQQEYERTPIPVISEDNKITYTKETEPITVIKGNTIIYNIRIYNEGIVNGYASEIMDDIPEGLEFLPEHETNIEFGWKMYKLDEDNQRVEVTDVSEATIIVTDYLSKANEENNNDNLIIGFDPETMSIPANKEVQVAFKVSDQAQTNTLIINTAEIADDSNENGEPIEDIDSTPNNNVPSEDDIDTEVVKVAYFDLSLKKFATKLNDTDITDREPTVDVTPLIEGTATDADYTLKKEPPVDVQYNDIVVFTIRVYNEGLIDGYASEVSDYIPEGLEFLPEHEINTQYGWQMYKINDQDEKEPVTDVTEAMLLSTEYLSKEQEEEENSNLLRAFNPENDEELDYRDIQVAFRVLAPVKINQIIINIAEITNDSDSNGNEIDDEDSTPANRVETEDDQDFDKLKLKYFDLALLKYVTKVTITENGNTTVRETGYNGLEAPEPIVKVEIKRSKLNTTIVKFTYTIKVVNEGEIEGYAKEIRDYVPQGLKFVQEDNPDWTIDGDTIVTRKLENTLLQPGESATVELTLTWENSENNLGEKINKAEISEDDNPSKTPDIDSTPDNNKDGEDDIDRAHVILSIPTGKITIYFTLTTIILTMLAGGVVLIKKYVF